MSTALEPIVLPLTSMHLIEASAGTGKTWTICNLYLRLILGHGDYKTAFNRPLAVNEILVVTFTIAATEELRSRIRDRILQAKIAFQANESGDPFIQQLISDTPDRNIALKLLESASQLMDEAAIFTIHGFCSRVLNENAFETGQLFEQELVEDSGYLLEQATEDFWRRTILTQNGSLLPLILELWRGPASLAKEIAAYIRWADLKIIPDGSTWPQLEDARATLVEKIEQLKQLWTFDEIPKLLLSSDIGKKRKPVTSARLQAMSEFAQSQQFEFRFNRDEGWDIWSTESITRALKKGGNFPTHAIFQIFDYLSAHFAAYKSDLRNYLVNDAISSIRESMARQQGATGSLTYDDLLTGLAEALQDPDQGARLKAILSNQYPVAMVDEFQDTDRIQYDIFNRIYGQGSDTGFLMIGDPKQAIYKFRGADIFTYIKARRNVEDLKDSIFTLRSNWRSTPALVEATNQLFSGREVFLNDRDIPFEAVVAAKNDSENCLLVDGKPPSPLTIHFAPEDDARLSKARAIDLLVSAAADETVRLLNSTTLVKGAPLDPGQIAYLVRNSSDAVLVQAALASRGLKSVFVTRDSVFQTETAKELLIFLNAVANPTDERLVRTALSISLMSQSAEQIDAINTDPIAHQALMEEFSNYHYLWQQHSLLPMINLWINQRNIAGQLLARDGGDRILTDLRHLGELLQNQMMTAPGGTRLLVWLRRHIRNELRQESDEFQLRLESDSDLIKIVTMHGAKGLEYDIVMVPMAVFGRIDAQPFYHRELGDDFENILDLSGSSDALDESRQEQLAEDIRLLYVAVTRARYLCCIGLANLAGSHGTLPFHQTAMAHILGLAGTKRDDASIIEKLTSLAELKSSDSLPLFDWQMIFDGRASTRVHQVASPEKLHRPPAPPPVHDSWRVTSYSALSRGSAHISTPSGIGDEPVADLAVGPESSEDNRFSFARGAKPGIMLHDLLQHIEFDITYESLNAALENHLTRHGYHALQNRWLPVLNRWIQDVLHTPLHAAGGFALRDVQTESRLNELEFHFPIEKFLTVASLKALLVNHEYMDKNQDLEFGRVQGLMTGSIDLVFEHGGLFYLLDYKSNYLGPDYEYYDPASIQRAMSDHQYHLQYLIYSVALNRYLKNRLPTYDYETHFGGVFYLFLRGMAGGDSHGQGVYFNKPGRKFLDRLDHLFRES